MAEQVFTWRCPACGEQGWGVVEQMYHWKELHRHNCKGETTMATQTPTRSPLEIARQRVADAEAKLKALEIREQARAEMGERYRSGQTIEQLVEASGWSEERVRAALAAVGALVPRKRKLLPEEVGQATAMLKSGSSIETVADDLNAAYSVIKRLAKELGIGPAPVRKRSEEQMQDLIKLEEQVRQVYGAGFAALGEALRKYRAQQPEAPTPEPEKLAPLQLSPEDEAKMNEPDDISTWP